MSVNIDAAERFVLINARLLDRHRLAVLLHGAPVAPVLDALRAYRNPDGGFGHALEPDVRAPESDTASTLHALAVLDQVGALDDPMVSDAAVWLGSIAQADGGVPFLPGQPGAPFLRPSDGSSFLTFALSGALWRASSSEPWLERATDWCWARLERPDMLDAYAVKSALDFLDSVPDEPRADAAIERLRGRLAPDGSMRVSGGIEGEQLTPVALSGRPGSRSRVLFSNDQIEADLDQLEREQQEDGGWTFDWLDWSPGQSVECRGLMTVRALLRLTAHGRIELPRGGHPVGRAAEERPAVVRPR
jgi:hypothetical protein